MPVSEPVLCYSYSTAREQGTWQRKYVSHSYSPQGTSSTTPNERCIQIMCLCVIIAKCYSQLSNWELEELLIIVILILNFIYFYFLLILADKFKRKSRSKSASLILRVLRFVDLIELLSHFSFSQAASSISYGNT